MALYIFHSTTNKHLNSISPTIPQNIPHRNPNPNDTSIDVAFCISFSVQLMEKFEIAGSRPKKQSPLQRIPWLALASLLFVLACMGASVATIVISDNQTVASWTIQPAVQLAILAVLSNVALGIAFSEAVVVTWWTSAARECHGFTNPCGLRSRVVTGTGTGWQIVTPAKPVPVARV